MANDLDFLKKRGYVQGSFENRLSQLGITPDKSISGSNVNPGEFSKYIQNYNTNLQNDPAGTLKEYSIVDTGYNEAKQIYKDMLPVLTTRYNDILEQLKGEEEVSQGRNEQLSNKEDIALRNEIAKRGLAVSDTDSFYAGQANKLQEGQDLRAKETGLDFSGKRIEATESQTSNEMNINSMLAGLTTDQANSLAGILSTEKSRISQVLEGVASDKQYSTNLQYQQERDKVADDQWQRTFDFTKSEAAADRAMALAKMAASGKKDSDYAKDVLSVVENAYTSSNKFPGMREAIQAVLESQYPNKSDEIAEDIKKYFPNGWESLGTSTTAPAIKKVMDELGVDEETAKKLLQQEAGL